MGVKMRKVFLDDLPRWENGEGNGNVGTINWGKCVGKKIDFIYDDIKGEFKIAEYQTNNSKLTIEYKDVFFNIHAGSFTRGQIGCLIGRKTKDFKINVGQRINDLNRDLFIIDREHRKSKSNRNRKWYKYKCNVCGYDDGWIEENNLLNLEQGCSCCRGMAVVLGINTIWDTDRWMCDLGVSEEDAKRYGRGNNKKIKVTCPYCELKKMISINSLRRNRSIGCTCGDGYSMGHKYIYELLIQLKVDFIDNYSPDWCRYYNKYKSKDSCGEYDFFIEDMKLIIEVDGGFHRKDNKMNGQTLVEVEYIDDIKDQIAKDNGYEVVRIPYGVGDFSENILTSKLKKIFDLNKVNWCKCEEFSLKNIVKEVCLYWDKKEEWEKVTDLVKTFGLSRSTVRNYLKKGSKLGWCYYDGVSEVNKSYIELSQRNKICFSKKVKIVKNNETLGIFDSIAELERQSEIIFKTKLHHSAISKVCLGKQKLYKGFTFEYIDESHQIAG